ncbi:crossover junction endodeoxyribonuclease RuvC [Bacteriovoracaceae bacterium]|nr:crossover junction endodeoxyribonuclease RuvC [Bacteriovoracaceae bacterium]
MIVLGIDPGSINTGFAFLQQGETHRANQYRVIRSGAIKTDSKIPFQERLKIIQNEFLEVLKSEKIPQMHISMESLIYVKSPTSLIKLAQTRGLLISCLYQMEYFQIHEYSPNLIKTTVTGHGHATKESMALMLQKILKVKNFSSHDESDAIATAFCHLLRFPTNGPSNANVKKSTGKRNLQNSLSHLVNR